jgi:hypothetical protein
MAVDDYGPGYGGGLNWKEREFVCRVCGNKEFRRAQVTGPNGKRRDTELLQCCRCSVLFANWRDFTAAR